MTPKKTLNKKQEAAAVSLIMAWLRMDAERVADRLQVLWRALSDAKKVGVYSRMRADLIDHLETQKHVIP